MKSGARVGAERARHVNVTVEIFEVKDFSGIKNRQKYGPGITSRFYPFAVPHNAAEGTGCWTGTLSRWKKYGVLAVYFLLSEESAN
jgi:hypothetical protein